MVFYTVLYIFALVLSVSDVSKNRQMKLLILLFFLLCLSVLVGIRGKTGADSSNYMNFFVKSTTGLLDYDSSIKRYSEEGFYFISAAIKTFTNNYLIYFILIAIITFSFYYKSIRYFSIFPLLSVAYYLARFMPFREMNQIRGALAIAVIIYSLRFLVSGKKCRYVIGCIVASLFHFSSIIVLPFVFFAQNRFTVKRIIILILFSFIAGFFIQAFLKSILLSSGNVVMLTYVGEKDLGYHNPNLYYQIGVCVLYSYFGAILEPMQKGYSVLRNAYLYSVLILCLTAGLGTIGGRLSTIFATCEIFIIPSFILVFKQKYIGAATVLTLISLIFLMNYNRMAADSAIWSYKLPFI